MPDSHFATTEELRELLAPIVSEPGRSAVMTDLDGTLAPIVGRPDETAIPGPTLELLERIAGRYRATGVVSGRPTRDAREITGLRSLHYIGNHGFEALAPDGEEPQSSPALADSGRAVRDFAEALDPAECEAAGVSLEDKGAIVALHWRRADDRASAAGFAERVGAEAEGAGLALHRGRMVLELRPPVEIDKGVGLETWLERHAEIERVFYGGDDATDADAFERLDALRASGRLSAIARVGVISGETPDRVRESADLVVPEVDGYLPALEILAGG